MSNEQDTRRKARSDYVYRRMTGATISLALNISQATFGRWKKAAKAAGDDWDLARSASIIAGEGIETVVSSVVEDFMIMAQALLEEIKNGELTMDQKVKHLVALADAMTKMPNWINHGLWMRAQRIAKGDTAKAQAAFVAEAVMFEGEKLTITDLAELVPAGDVLQLIGEVFGKDGGAETEDGDEGNGVTAH
ncbi:DUF1804 family protein [Rhizobium sp. SL86]|uniref:DUF1804 family protein n=1 Tax=Rhizobium sp. SL86 TaxID=2995148 RepID=UPI0022730E73|nr:DUF1804 family protein [Rhizobium sp. SL86]MCY1668066.1 DUF1804 family protein [Rhizobium sp. SL86]